MLLDGQVDVHGFVDELEGDLLADKNYGRGRSCVQANLCDEEVNKRLEYPPESPTYQRHHDVSEQVRDLQGDGAQREVLLRWRCRPKCDKGKRRRLLGGNVWGNIRQCCLEERQRDRGVVPAADDQAWRFEVHRRPHGEFPHLGPGHDANAAPGTFHQLEPSQSQREHRRQNPHPPRIRDLLREPDKPEARDSTGRVFLCHAFLVCEQKAHGGVRAVPRERGERQLALEDLKKRRSKLHRVWFLGICQLRQLDEAEPSKRNSHQGPEDLEPSPSFGRFGRCNANALHPGSLVLPHRCSPDLA
mmetsp:Transcript_10422/g.26481  ORF Transcript_10422/g.26481 Transcript_10422/m.26481 type:complete len:302 (+) Transcript_10422:659-1564(+)